MPQQKQTGWKVFDERFKEGDFVVVVDMEDGFHCGLLAADEDGVLLRTREGKAFINWIDIRFIAHDGFPFARFGVIAKLTGLKGTNRKIWPKASGNVWLRNVAQTKGMIRFLAERRCPLGTRLRLRT